MNRSICVLSVSVLFISACEKNNKPAPVQTSPGLPTNTRPFVKEPVLPYTDTFIGASYYTFYDTKNATPYYNGFPIDTSISAMLFVTHQHAAGDSLTQELIFFGNINSDEYCHNMSGMYLSSITESPLSFVFKYDSSNSYRQLSPNVSFPFCLDSAFLRNDSLILGGYTTSPGQGCASGCTNSYNFYGKKK